MKTLLLVSALVLASCAPATTVPDPQPVSVSPSREGIRFSAEKVSTGLIRLALDNGAPHAIGYNLCSSELQQRTGSGWTAVPTDDVCTMQLMTLGAGRDATFEKRMPAGLAAGEYRYVTSVETPIGTAAIRIATDPFTH